VMVIQPAREEPTIIFLHIPKSGGITLHRILERHFRRPERFRVRAPRMAESIRWFAEVPEERRRQMRLIWGHVSFGIHEFVPRTSTYVTLLRNPVKRVISHYLYVVRRPEHPHHRMLTTDGLTLSEYIRSGIAFEVDNQQTRALAGDFSTPFGHSSEEMLKKAKSNIEGHFSLVGLTERFDESLVVLKHVFGWSRLFYVAVNVGGTRVGPASISAQARKLIEEHNELDLRLYAYAKKRFEETIARYPRFEDDLRRFRRLNSVYRPWGTVTYAFPRQVLERTVRNIHPAPA
jgi:hypothetical protein